MAVCRQVQVQLVVLARELLDGNTNSQLSPSLNGQSYADRLL
jgi:hypothetical protein